jgi:YesN/AraC family two-component response regulator
MPGQSERNRLNRQVGEIQHQLYTGRVMDTLKGEAKMPDSEPKGKGILVIDDCEITRESLGALFREDFIVFLAGTASDGLRMLTDGIDIVILDYTLPDRDGADLLKEVKTLRPSIPVIIITGHGSEEICQTVFRLGAMDYMKKPFDPQEIRARVRILLTLRAAGAERRRCVFRENLTEGARNAYAEIPPNIVHCINRVKEYIDRNYTAGLRIREITKEAGINRTYFCKYFKIIFGRTFKDYLVHARLTMARKLLKDGNLPVSDVADRVGYSPKYFSEVYRRSFGVPPKKSPK